MKEETKQYLLKFLNPSTTEISNNLIITMGIILIFTFCKLFLIGIEQKLITDYGEILLITIALVTFAFVVITKEMSTNSTLIIVLCGCIDGILLLNSIFTNFLAYGVLCVILLKMYAMYIQTKLNKGGQNVFQKKERRSKAKAS